jgi:hypothetical protein
LLVCGLFFDGDQSHAQHEAEQNQDYYANSIFHSVAMMPGNSGIGKRASRVGLRPQKAGEQPA